VNVVLEVVVAAAALVVTLAAAGNVPAEAMLLSTTESVLNAENRLNVPLDNDTAFVDSAV
jgi:hypothetical protein